MGIDPKMLPAYFGHDGYPNVPIDGGGKDASIAQFAEWLLQANHFLPVVRDPDGRSVLVLKTVKLVWDIETYLEILGPAAEWIVVDRPARYVFASINEKAGRAALADTPLDPKINIERWIAAYWQIENPDQSPEGLWEAFSAYYAGYRSRLQEKIPAHQLIRIPYEAHCLEGFLKDRVQRWGGVYHHEAFQVKTYYDPSVI